MGLSLSALSAVARAVKSCIIAHGHLERAIRLGFVQTESQAVLRTREMSDPRVPSLREFAHELTAKYGDKCAWIEERDRPPGWRAHARIWLARFGRFPP